MADVLTVSGGGGSPVTLTLRGQLDEETARAIWSRLIEAASGAPEVVFDLTDLTEFEGAGLALLSDADQRARAAGAKTTFRGVSDGLAELLRMAHHDEPDETHERRPPNLFEEIGGHAAAVLGSMRLLISFVGDLARAILIGFASLNPSRIKEIIGTCTRVGADAVPVVSLLGGLVGFILAVPVGQRTSEHRGPPRWCRWWWGSPRSASSGR